MTYVGVDGCKRGWFFVRSDGGRLAAGIVCNLVELVAAVPDESSIRVDIPIGLRDDVATPRGCDIAARKMLGPKRASSVFPAPIRAILNDPTHAEASSKSRVLTGKGISQQAFAIMPKIREVDELILSSERARRSIREIHPEVCFWGLNGGAAMMNGKKSEAGFAERMALLETHLPGATEIANQVLSEFLRKDVARDDIADALAALVTAMAPPGFMRTVPENPERDSCELPMEMVYGMWGKQNVL